MIKLIDLEPQFLRVVEPGRRTRDVEGVADAQGVMFLCPKCFANKGGPAGVHSVMCWFRDHGVPDNETPGPGRWAVSGTGYHDLTLSPSVHLTGAGCGWHGFVTAGEVTSC